MDDMNRPLVDMFNLLCFEEGVLIYQISKEQEESERLKMSHDLRNVRFLLSEITSKLTVLSPVFYQQNAGLFTQENRAVLSR